MSLNALGVSKLALPANSSVVAGAAFSYGSGAFAGLTPANYDVIVGTTGAFVAGVSTVALNSATAFTITSQAQATACIIEAWYVLPAVPAAAGITTIGAKYQGFLTFAVGPPATAVVTFNAIDGTGALVNTFTGTCNFRIYVPRLVV